MPQKPDGSSSAETRQHASATYQTSWPYNPTDAATVTGCASESRQSAFAELILPVDAAVGRPTADGGGRPVHGPTTVTQQNGQLPGEGNWPSTCTYVVGVAGFEPTASSSRTTPEVRFVG